MNALEQLQILVDELNEDNSSTYKQDVLSRHPECKRLLERVYSNFETFGVTSKTILAYADSGTPLDNNPAKHPNIFSLLDDLATRRLSGHAALAAVLTFIARNSEYGDLIFKIIDRNLETRANGKMINNVWPGLIETYDVALAKDIEKITKGHLPDFQKDNWYASRKLDGLRNITEVSSAGDSHFSSRRGREFTSLSVLGKAIKQHVIIDDAPFVFDGEGCIVDEEGIEDFNAAVSEIKRKDHTVENPRYYIIDLLSLKDFKAKVSTNLFSDRQKWLKRVLRENDYIKIVPQILVRDQAHLDELFLMAQEKGWEGLILRKDTTYKGKRSTDLLKLKAHIDDEYEVIAITTEVHRLIILDEEVEKEVVSAVTVIHKGQEVSVGSGWQKDQRIYYFDHQDELLGATITVRHNGETKNKQGTVSLRFPRIKTIHGKEGRTT